MLLHKVPNRFLRMLAFPHLNAEILACVASVSSRVIPFFALVPVFSTNSRGTACYAGYRDSGFESKMRARFGIESIHGTGWAV